MDRVEGVTPAPAGAGATRMSAGEAMAKAAGAQSASHLAEQVGVPYNGGRTERYHWEQTLTDVTIHVPVPAGTRARGEEREKAVARWRLRSNIQEQVACVCV